MIEFEKSVYFVFASGILQPKNRTATKTVRSYDAHAVNIIIFLNQIFRILIVKRPPNANVFTENYQDDICLTKRGFSNWKSNCHPKKGSILRRTR